MGNEALQSLSRQYARGEISTPEYRQLRKDVIDDATGVDQVVELQSGRTTPSNNSVFLKVSIISIAVIASLVVLYSSL